MPQYRNRMWDGKIRLFSIQTGEIYFGLLSYIEEFAKRNDIEIEYKEGVKDDEQLGDSELVQGEFIGRVSPQSKGKTLQVRDYQIRGGCIGLCNQKQSQSLRKQSS